MKIAKIALLFVAIAASSCIQVVQGNPGTPGSVAIGPLRFPGGRAPQAPAMQIAGAPPFAGGPSCGPTGYNCEHSHYSCIGGEFVAEVFAANDAGGKTREVADARYNYLCSTRPPGTAASAAFWNIYPPHGERQP